jgi:Fe-only nitrogenase accessory protein AnfO
VTGETVSLNQPGNLLLFQKKLDTWQVAREYSFALNQEKGLREMRKQMTELLASLAECKVIVADSITGVPYYELERAGFSVWEFSGKPADFLDHVLDKEAAVGKEATVSKVIRLPAAEELGNGIYRISIKEIQESDAGVTSKQILMPLLRRTGWYQVEVLCNHIPPWLEAEVIMRRLACETKRNDPGEVLVTLRKKVCGE